MAAYDPDGFYTHHSLIHAVKWDLNIQEQQDPGTFKIHPDSSEYDIRYIDAMVLSSAVSAYFGYFLATGTLQGSYTSVYPELIRSLPVKKIQFCLSPSTRKEQARYLMEAYEEQRYQTLLSSAYRLIDDNQSEVIHDFLVCLIEKLTLLHKTKQLEIERFLNGLERSLRIRPNKNAITGIESLSGKSLIQNYLGDYQRGQSEVSWEDFYYRLHQNRSRFGVNLEQVKGQIQAEYEKSLAILLPIKEQLAATDALIDKIVYRLYGLTDEEIALIEQPAYEQALADAKAKVLDDKKLQKDTDAAVDAIAEAILPAARLFQARVPLPEDRASLDDALPGWHLLPDPVPTFLLTGEYNVRTQPEGLDFSTSVIPYAKAIETTIVEHLLMPFRDDPATTASDCRHQKLQGFLEGKSAPSLGEIKDILRSKKEKALREHIRRRVPTADETIFGQTGVSELLSDEERLFKRNRAAHDTVLTHSDAVQIREWALKILRYL